jgi:hypothetical protein
MTMTYDTAADDERVPLHLRGRHVTSVTWTEDAVVFELDPPARITVGRGALFTDEPFGPDTPRTNLGQLPRAEVEQVVGAVVLAATAWTAGTMRVAFAQPTRHLTVIRSGMFVPVTIDRDGRTVWTREG